MEITNAQYFQDFNGDICSIGATIEGQEIAVPLDPANRHYTGIVEATAINGSFWGDTVPEPMATEAATWLFNTQATDYRTATARIAQYQLSVGRPEVTEMMPTGEQVYNEETMEMEDVLEEVITQTAIEPLEPTVEITVYDEEDPMAEPTTETVPNPLIVADDAERAEAQTVIDNTPEPVKEHVDNE